MRFMLQRLLTDIERGSKNALTKKKIISYYLTNRSSTIPELAKELDHSIPTTTKIIVEMCDEGLLLNYGKLETSEGRPPALYGLNADGGYFMGVNVRRAGIDIGIINLIGDLIDEEQAIPMQLENTPEYLDELCSAIKNFIAKSPVDTSRLFKIGINLSGRINPDLGYSFSYFNFDERPLTELLSEKIGIPVCLENDTRAMAYGELLRGQIKNAKDVLFVNLSWGLGSAIIIDEKLYNGKSGFSGEIGHFPIFDNELLCHCGKKGCLETEVSGIAFNRLLHEAIAEGKSSILSKKIKAEKELSLKDIVDAVNREDLLCIEILEDIAQKLGRYLAGMINFVNPELVILGGTLADTGDYLLQPVKTAIRKYSLNLVSKDSTIIISKLGDRAGVIGACLITRNKMFD